MAKDHDNGQPHENNMWKSHTRKDNLPDLEFLGGASDVSEPQELVDQPGE